MALTGCPSESTSTAKAAKMHTTVMHNASIPTSGRTSQNEGFHVGSGRLQTALDSLMKRFADGEPISSDDTTLGDSLTVMHGDFSKVLSSEVVRAVSDASA